MTESMMTPMEKVDAKAILDVFKDLKPENQRVLFYMGLGMHYGNTCLSKDEEKEDGREESGAVSN